MGNANYRTIKIQSTSYDKLQQLVGELSRRGWTSIGVNRNEPPLLCTVVDEAISALLTRVERNERSERKAR